MGKPVQIVSPDPNKKEGYCVARDELERIFAHPQVAKTPVSIYSIAGAYRKGKSFMLSFFLRYLSSVKSNKSDSWLETKNDKLVDGFAWRGGAERHTQGIWIWDEPFFVNTPQGKTALFLMDTQGAYDPNSSVKDCSAIFALSTFMSSVQVYNVKEQIQEDTLQNFQLFTEYATAAKHRDEDLEEPFQTLVFLIRDWQDKSYEYGLDGGQKVLDGLLQPQVLHHDTESVRKSLRNSFQTIKCCLMPHPGFAVAERTSDDGNQLSLKEIREEFLETVDALVRNIFAPDRLMMKKVNNKFVSGNDFINFTLRYYEQLSSGKLPKVETIYEATAKAALLSVCEDCIAMYERLMKEGTTEGNSRKSDFIKHHATSKEEVLRLFHQQSKFGGKKLIDEYKKYLTNKIDDGVASWKAKYEANVAKQRRLMFEKCDEIREKYIRSIHETCRGEHGETVRLEKIEPKLRKKALENFEKLDRKFPSRLVSKHKTDFLKEVEIEWAKFLESKRRRQAAIQAQLDLLISKATTKYRQLMKDKCGKKFLTEDEFSKVHEACANAQLEYFDRSKIAQETQMKILERDRLCYEINQIKDDLMKANKAKKNSLRVLQKVREDYSTKMYEMLGSGPMSDEELLEAHKRCKPKSNGRMPEAELNQIIDDEFSDIKKGNSHMKKIALAELNHGANEAFEKYCEKMSEAGNGFTEEGKLEALHDKAKKVALRKFGKLKKPLCLSEKIESMIIEVEKRIDAYYMKGCEVNKANKEKLDQLGGTIASSLMSDYVEHMKNVSQGVYVRESVLQGMHDQFMKHCVETKLSELNCCAEIKQKWMASCAKKLAAHFQHVRKSNEEAKPVCPRVQEEPKSEGMDGTAALAAGISGASGAVIGAKLGAYAGSLAGPLGAGAGAVLGATVGYSGARLCQWWNSN